MRSTGSVCIAVLEWIATPGVMVAAYKQPSSATLQRILIQALAWPDRVRATLHFGQQSRLLPCLQMLLPPHNLHRCSALPWRQKTIECGSDDILGMLRLGSKRDPLQPACPCAGRITRSCSLIRAYQLEVTIPAHLLQTSSTAALAWETYGSDLIKSLGVNTPPSCVPLSTAVNLYSLCLRHILICLGQTSLTFIESLASTDVRSCHHCSAAHACCKSPCASSNFWMLCRTY